MSFRSRLTGVPKRSLCQTHRNCSDPIRWLLLVDIVIIDVIVIGIVIIIIITIIIIIIIIILR